MISIDKMAQKHLIKILTETHPSPQMAYQQAIATAPSKETAEAIKGIYEKLKKQKSEKLYQLKEYLKGLETCGRYGVEKATPEIIAELKSEIEQLEKKIKELNDGDTF